MTKRARASRQTNRPRALRTTVALWLATVFLVWTIPVVGWFVVKTWSVANHHVVLNAGIKAINASHRLETAFLGYRREDLLWHMTGGSEHREHRDEYLKTAQEAAKSLTQYAKTPQEKATEIQIQETLKVLEQQLPIASATPPEAEVQSSEETLAAIGNFRNETEAQMEDSIEAADHLYQAITYWMVGLSAGTAVLLLAGAMRFLRRIIRPILALTHSAEAFGRGDLTTRAPVAYDDEVGALARTFNNMATDIADRDQERLRFVAMVAHDLKNPVHAIQVALRELGRSRVSEEDRLFYVNGALEETERLKKIVRDVTDDTQVATGHFSLTKTEMDLGMLVRRLVESQRDAHATHEIVVEAPAGCVIQGDPERMERVVMNLFSNAIKYSPAHTRVTVRVARTDSHALLSVWDQGPGIAKEDLSAVFQPFGRGRSAASLAEGTGMGLYVARQIVEAHGGRIEVRNEPGRGTTFLIELPLAPTPQPV